jgi:hypothetical protein
MSSCDNLSSYAGTIELNDSLTLNFQAPEIASPPPDTGSKSVHLTWSVSRYIDNATDGIRVRIVADQAVDMPTKIFAYMLSPMKPSVGEKVANFDHVCSPVDLEEYPEDEPLPGLRPEWFRLNYVDILVRSRAEAHDFIKDVIEDVQRLKTTLNLMDNLVPGGEMWIGSPPSSSSESSTGA